MSGNFLRKKEQRDKKIWKGEPSISTSVLVVPHTCGAEKQTHEKSRQS